MNSAFEFAAFFTAPIVGHHLKRIKKKRSMIIGLFVVALGTIG